MARGWRHRRRGGPGRVEGGVAAGEHATEAEAAAPWAGGMAAYGVAIALGAFLLFAVQPLIARYILPWFGGSIDVWTTCLLFFQVMLLLGYLYAHLSRSFLPLRGQAILHGVVVVAAIAFLPIIPTETFRPTGVGHPALRILWLLLANAGVPFFALAATSPLLQSWVSALRPERDAYRLYALSNVGSLAALVSYPFLVEPLFARHTQSWIWSAGLLLYALVFGACARPVFAGAATDVAEARAPAAGGRPPGSRPGRDHDAARSRRASNPARLRWAWLLLPAAASMLLLASTNMICLEVASIPFLWVLPLTLYLVTFILCFAGGRWYSRPFFVTAAVLAGLAVAGLRYNWFAGHSIGLQLVVYMAALFASCMVAHGETYRARPEPAELTSFYLLVSLGGALGGFAVAIVAPLVLRGYLELYIAMPLCLALAVAAMRPAAGRRVPRWRLFRAVGVAAVGGAGALLLLAGDAPGRGVEIVERMRNFYGVLRVQEVRIDSKRGGPDVELVVRQVFNGPIGHGSQVVDVRALGGGARSQGAGTQAALATWEKEARALPTTYYSEHAGGVAMLFDPDGAGRPRRIGIVGLGAGTLAVYGRPGDTIRYFELNPDVEQVANRYFTYLEDARKRGVNVEVVLGDGRLSLQKEASRSLDILVVDAFTGDAIPLHMLTEEAFGLYLDRLKDDGVLEVHVTNGHLDLRWVVARIARSLHVPVAFIHHEPKPGEILFKESDWMLLSRNPGLMDSAAVRPHLIGDGADLHGAPLWTDEYSSLFAALRRRGS